MRQYCQQQDLIFTHSYGQEIRPAANPKIIEAITQAECIVYSIGSLYTSIIPSLILRGVGNAIARRAITARKVLILNGTIDRESGPSNTPFTAMDFIHAIARACLESAGIYGRDAELTELRSYVTHLIYVEGEGTPMVDKEALSKAGIEGIRVYGRKARAGEKGSYYDEGALKQALQALMGKRDGRYSGHTRRNTLLS